MSSSSSAVNESETSTKFSAVGASHDTNVSAVSSVRAECSTSLAHVTLPHSCLSSAMSDASALYSVHTTSRYTVIPAAATIVAIAVTSCITNASRSVHDRFARTACTPTAAAIPDKMKRRRNIVDGPVAVSKIERSFSR